MRKKGLVLVVMGLVGFIFLKDAQAAWPWQKQGQSAVSASVQKEQVSTPAPAAVVVDKEVKPVAAVANMPSVATASEIEKQRMQRDKKKTQLNGNQWDVEMMSLSGKGVKQPDVIIFSENKFFSEVFGKLGFGATNYTLTVIDDGTTVVETMQSAEKEGIVFWRMEFDKDLAGCKGIYSRQLGQNKTEDFSFSSIGKKPYAGQLAKPAAPAASVEAKTATPATDTVSKKK